MSSSHPPLLKVDQLDRGSLGPGPSEDGREGMLYTSPSTPGHTLEKCVPSSTKLVNGRQGRHGSWLVTRGISVDAIHSRRSLAQHVPDTDADGLTLHSKIIRTAMGSSAPSRSGSATRYEEILRHVMNSTKSSFPPNGGVGNMAISFLRVFAARYSLSRLSSKRLKGFSRSFRRLVRLLTSVRRFYRARGETSDRADVSTAKFCKYHTDLLLFQALQSEGQEPERKPEFSSFGNLFTGLWNRIVRRKIRSRRPDVRFIFSLQKGCKQSWDKAGPEIIQDALNEHFELLSRPFDPPMSDRAYGTIVDVSNMVFRGFGRGSLRGPSSNASFLHPRKEGGAFSAYPKLGTEGKQKGLSSGLRPLRDLRGTGGPESPSYYGSPDEFSYLESRGYVPIRFRKPIKIGSLHNLQEQLVTYRDRVHSTALLSAEGQLVRRPNGSLPFNDVRVAAVPEDGYKVRIVTAARHSQSVALSPLQDSMLASWRRSPNSTMLHPDLTQKVSQMCEILWVLRRKFPNSSDLRTGNLRFFSVDYKSATDGVRKQTSFASIAGMEGHPQYDLGVHSLGTAQANYNGSTRGVLNEGQLMGHVLSFPCLCVTNLSVVHLALDWWLEEAKASSKYRVRDSISRAIRDTCLVNGDDLLLYGPVSLRKHLGRAVAEMGFTYSAGKNYTSARFGMINSQLFQICDGRVVRLGYLNQRILTALGSSDGSLTPLMVAREIPNQVKLCPWVRGTVRSSVESWNRRIRGQGRPNWYLPIHLGGLGMTSLVPDDLIITRWQRTVAATFLANPRLKIFENNAKRPRTRKLLKSGFTPTWRAIDGPERESLQNNLPRGGMVIFDPNKTVRIEDSLALGVNAVYRGNDDSVYESRSQVPSDWGGRLRQVDYYMNGKTLLENDFRCWRTKDMVRVKRMTVQGIGDHWFSYVLRYNTVPVPPLP